MWSSLWLIWKIGDERCITLVGYIIFNKGVEQLGASKASIYLNLTPIVTTLISVLLYSSTMTWKQTIGMCMVLIGVYIATTNTTSKNENIALHE
ncbi:EamA family transporter [Brevibacillus daliensis]|uniref:EamA family transporter n=1 Tax=Brevibacillus daliensis TaxID=2892995 RepID=UPI0035A1469D